MNTFGKRLVAAREKLGLSQKEFAELLEITPTRLNYWEKDKREPNVAMIRKISKVLKVDPNFLIGNWAPDIYEDFQKLKTDAERLTFFDAHGVPIEYSSLYEAIAPPLSRKFSDEKILLFAYNRAPDVAKQACMAVVKGDPLAEKLVRLVDSMLELNEEARDTVLNCAIGLVASGRYVNTENKKASPLQIAARTGDDLSREDFSRVILPDTEDDVPV